MIFGACLHQTFKDLQSIKCWRQLKRPADDVINSFICFLQLGPLPLIVWSQCIPGSQDILKVGHFEVYTYHFEVCTIFDVHLSEQSSKLQSRDKWNFMGYSQFIGCCGLPKLRCTSPRPDSPDVLGIRSPRWTRRPFGATVATTFLDTLGAAQQRRPNNSILAVEEIPTLQQSRVTLFWSATKVLLFQLVGIREKTMHMIWLQYVHIYIYVLILMLFCTFKDT